MTPHTVKLTIFCSRCREVTYRFPTTEQVALLRTLPPGTRLEQARCYNQRCGRPIWIYARDYEAVRTSRAA